MPVAAPTAEPVAPAAPAPAPAPKPKPMEIPTSTGPPKVRMPMAGMGMGYGAQAQPLAQAARPQQAQAPAPAPAPKINNNSNMEAPTSPEVELQFTLGCAETAMGETIRVVGNLAELGGWDPAQGLLLETKEGQYPKWTTGCIYDAKGAAGEVEYKYVRDKRACGEDFQWESCVKNRTVKVKPSMGGKMLEIYDDAFDCDTDPTVVVHSRAGDRASDADERSTYQDTADTRSESSEEKAASLHNVPTTVSLAGDKDCMHRLASLSALDRLIDDPEELVKMREEMEDMEDTRDDRPVRYPARHLDTPIVICASECNPWSKTGGLAMVASSYGYEFAMRGHRTMVVQPMYGFVEGCEWKGKAHIQLDGGSHEVNYFVQYQKYGKGRGCNYVFIDHHCFKRPEGIYGPPGGEYDDNLFRFTLLTLACLEAPLILDLQGSTFGQDVLFIANDWQTGLLPVYMQHKYRKHGVYKQARSMMVIHNIGYQGKFIKSKYPLDSFLGLPWEAGEDLQGEDCNMGTDCINLLQGGCKVCDRVLTVSPNYAMEIQSPEGACGMHEILRWKAGAMRLAGILNGIADEWNPSTDKFITKNYSIEDYKEGKAANKAALQKELGLDEDPGACLLGFCGRLCYQKGMPLILGNIQWMFHGHGAGRMQLIMMGKGEPEYQSRVAQAEQQFKGKICGYVGFDPKVEHKMMAGCDVLLMPSQYEPCGLPQMYAQAYGTLPVVHETGGLKDSVKGLWEEGRDRDTATGFLFTGFDENDMRGKIHKALELYHHRRETFYKMQENAMREDFYWPRMMDEYEQHVDWTMESNAFR